jgi:geranylgeranyl pyrophosphate synthase
VLSPIQKSMTIYDRPRPSKSVAAPVSPPGRTVDRPGHVKSAQQLLTPVRSGLQLVEVKMKGVESALFSPLANAFVDLISSGGKRVRPAIALMAAEFNGPIRSTDRYDQVISLAAAVEMLHTASLVHDDVIDGAMLRRGAPTLNANWPQGSTVLAGNYMFGQAAHFAAQTGNMRVIHIFSDTLQIIVNGELQQMRARHDYQQEGSSYFQRIYAKTASLFTAATESAAVLSGLAESRVQDLKAYGYNLGMAFQIVDDILDFTGDEQSLGKPAGSDLGQGTLTLPFFYFMQRHANPDAIIDRLDEARWQAEDGDRAAWSQAIQEVVHEVRRADAIDQANQEAFDFVEKARTNLDHLPDNIFKESMLGLCDFVVQRRN